ncbi:hypothetical protein CE91St41_20050 [Oscillospiraceae bacterium]|nr:hypothetical protein CE91St40_17470 [Oscillospiraceae bacterium]BDF75116.1 hypothetical protein CE91St41_20050 [Oscillospiraceae bacterium]
MRKLHQVGVWEKWLPALTSDCGRCRGLCCAALFFSKCEGFPADKAAGEPCAHLRPDYRCAVHGELARRGLRGCMAFDCLGAGQEAAALFPDGDWMARRERAGAQFAAFERLRHLHQTLWYLAEADCLIPAEGLRGALEALIAENRALCALPAGELTEAMAEEHRRRVNPLLHEAAALVKKAAGGSFRRRSSDYIGKNFAAARLDGADFSMALLIAADLSGCSLYGANLLGADLRDADLRGADLSECIFLTQGQVNGARGSRSTRLPAALRRPEGW